MANFDPQDARRKLHRIPSTVERDPPTKDIVETLEAIVQALEDLHHDLAELRKRVKN